MIQIADYSKRTEDLKIKASRTFEKYGIVTKKYLFSEKERIQVVLAGQYSAGKSSIAKMLTDRDDIEIGAGITTQKVSTYEWNGIDIIDTPGIHTQLRPDHDEMSYNAIKSADLLVFVVTNELFDSHVAEHFRKLAIDQDKAGEMLLVVNKMGRSSLGNTEEQQRIIIEDLRKVLDPYTPEQLRISFLDAESYLDSLKERDNDPRIADELFKRSGYEDFISNLNSFVAEKKLTAKLTTSLYVLEDQIEEAIERLEGHSEDTDIDALEEHYLQQHHSLVEAKNRLQQEVKDLYVTTASQIKNLGLEAANLIVSGCKQDEVENSLANSINKVNEMIDSCQNDAVQLIETRLNELGQAISFIEESEFSKELKSRLCGKFDKLPQGIKNMLTSAGPSLEKAGHTVINNAYKSGAAGGLKLTNFSGSNVHNIVLKAGHSIGFKFKPWQAVKITQKIALGGQVLGVLGVGLNVFMQIKSDQDEEKLSRILRENRQNIRSQFNSAAYELEEHGNDFIQSNVLLALEAPIEETHNNLLDIRKTKENRCQACLDLEVLEEQCLSLIQEIHSFDKIS